MKKLRIFLPVVVRPKGRGQITKHGGIMTPKKTRENEQALRAFLTINHRGAGFLEPPISVAFAFILPRGKTVKRPWPCVKPDIDNLVKQIKDSANGILWKDDAEIVESYEMKVYTGHAPAGILIVAEGGEWDRGRAYRLVDAVHEFILEKEMFDG